PRTEFDPSQQLWQYDVTPRQRLEKGKTYRLEVSPGLRSAKGNLPSATTFASQFSTYSPLAFETLAYVGQPGEQEAYGRFLKGAAQLVFNNPLVAASVADSIQITPAPKQGIPLLQAYDDTNVINLNPYALQPRTTYSITIAKSLKDKFGQTLDKPVTVQYETGDIAPDLWVPNGLNIFPTNKKDLQLAISGVNLPDAAYRAAYRVLKPTDLVYFEENSAGASKALPAPQTWASFPFKADKNRTGYVTVNLQQQLGDRTGMLAYGVRARTSAYQENGNQKWREGKYFGMVQVTNLGVFAQWFPQSGLVRVSHLSDGKAVANAAVEVYESKLEATSRPQPAPCATGKTDADGLLTFDRAALSTCMKGKSSFEVEPNLLVVAREGNDWAFTRTNDYTGAYGYGIYADWQGTKPIAKGILFSDRQLYQPGETAYITGVAYYLKDGQLQRDEGTVYNLSLEAPDGKVTTLPAQTTTKFGTFAVTIPLSASQPLGFYSLKATSAQGVELTGDFRVAEFKPPNFKTDLTLSGGIPGQPSATEPTIVATIGQKINVDVNSAYLFGAPVEGGKVNYYITRRRTYFTPTGWDAFTFGRQWYWPEEEPQVPTEVLQAEQVLNAQGRNSQQVPVTEIPYPMTYRVDAQVSDVSNLSVADSKSFTAVPGDKLIGIQTNFVGEAGKPFAIQVIVTDPSGRPIAGERVRLELQSMTYNRVTRVLEGSRVPQHQVEYKTVATAEIRSGTAAQTVTLTPTSAGVYRIWANFVNRRDELLATNSQVWVTGDGSAFWGDRYTNNRLDIQLDKKQYKPGDTATALIQSPYPQADLYFAVIRQKVLYQTIIPVNGSAPQVQFTVTPDMLPNAAVEAVLVRRGQPLEQLPDGSLKNLVKIGFTPFTTDLSDRYLQVSVQATPSLKPGEEQTIALALKDAAGKPAQGQFTVMVVNEAVLQLTGYRPPNLVEIVYSSQGITTRFADNRSDVILAKIPSPLDKGWGYGGGFSKGLASTRLRTDFKPVAYYNGAVPTDANGQATVKFKLPDNLTTWRVMAVAIGTAPISRAVETSDATPWLFGSGDATFVTTQPLVTNPVLPQFARPGDRFLAGIAITNTTGQAGTADVRAEVQNSIQFEEGKGTSVASSQTATLKLAATGTQLQSFPVVATTAGESTLRFTTNLNGVGDALEVTLPVKPLEVTEQVIESGSTEQSLSLPLIVDKATDPNTGGLELTLASTLIPQLVAPGKQVLDAEPLPLLELSASRLAIAANLEILRKTYSTAIGSFQPAQEAAQRLEQLLSLQREDGGFAYYPQAENSDPLVTPYAASAIAQARSAGFSVDGEMVTRLTAYLRKLLANPGEDDYCSDTRCQNRRRLAALIALADLDTPRTDFLSNLYEGRAQLTTSDQVRLARYLSRFPDWQTQATAMAQQLQQVVYDTGRSATVTLASDYWWWVSSPTVAQAEMLRLAIAQNADTTTLSRLVQGLLDQQRQGTWRNTYDTAQALTALVAYVQQQPTPPNFFATATLAGKPIVSAQFQGYQSPSTEKIVPMAELPQGNSNLTLEKAGNGTLHYRVAFRYRLQGNPPGRFDGLRVQRELRLAGRERPIAAYGLTTSAPVTIDAGQIYDVGLQIITDHPVDHVVITDPLPAGFEAIDTSFQTSTPYFQARGDSWEIGYQQIHRDRIVAYADGLEPGIYTLHYLVRAVTPGTFLWSGSEAHRQYAPEEFGRTATSTLVVKPAS
ncbi:MAG: alpha-2-macroglobulin family protein, partial [Cyanobacteria bacterium]|nr:alpha-2-macroglobulin family protein [Cyanobacteriota bacterium]MDW8200514.1 alpha-2-macroglobulin [Cyanobacteriota bacterium SKYGB_h_bin112]